ASLLLELRGEGEDRVGWVVRVIATHNRSTRSIRFGAKLRQVSRDDNIEPILPHRFHRAMVLLQRIRLLLVRGELGLELLNPAGQFLGVEWLVVLNTEQPCDGS